MAKISWKRFAEWVTGLRDKYRQDIFVRTQWNIIGLHVISGIFLLILISFAFQYLYEEVTQTIVDGIMGQLVAGTSDGGEIVQASQGIQRRHFIIVFIATTAVTVLIGFFTARVALAPARNALAFQKRFIGNIAHELRTPLSIIKTNSEVTLMDAGLDSKLRATLKDNITELNRASEIINNLLTFNNLIQPEQPRFEYLDLGAIVDISLKKLHGFAERQKIEIQVKKSTPRTVYGNKTALEQIVTNLVKNAITYTLPGGRVSVGIRPDYAGNILLTVQDTGIGISQNDLFHIFEPFYRAERSRSRRWGSSGLGLTIVSELLKIHRGKISVRSAVNKGTTILISLPYKGERGKGIDSSAPVGPDLNEVSMDYSNAHHIPGKDKKDS